MAKAKPEIKEEAKPEIKEEAKPEIKEEAKPEIKEEVAKTRVRRIPDKPKRTYVSAGTYTLSLPADQDEFLIPTADLVPGLFVSVSVR